MSLARWTWKLGVSENWGLTDIDGHWRILMDIDGHIRILYWWILMDIDGYWWTLMDIDGHWWILMDIDGYWWILMDINGYWWILMDIDAYWWILIIFHGFHGIVLVNQDFQTKPIQKCDVPLATLTWGQCWQPKRSTNFALALPVANLAWQRSPARKCQKSPEASKWFPLFTLKQWFHLHYMYFYLYPHCISLIISHKILLNNGW